MQYAFAYYHYLINRSKALDDWGDGTEARAGIAVGNTRPKPLIKPGENGTLALESFISTEIDTDGDGYINDNEFHSLACVVAGNPPCAKAAAVLRNCSSLAQNTTSVMNVIQGLAQMTTTRTLPRCNAILACPAAVEGIHIHLKDVFVIHEISKTGNDEVAFEMISDNATHGIHQLDSIRARRSKFICINDNMRDPPPELVSALDQFFAAMYPLPSAFELPPGQRNPSLYLDELRSHSWPRVADARASVMSFFNPIITFIASAALVAVVVFFAFN